MPKLSYTTPNGITVTRSASGIPYHKGLKRLLHKLDRYRGIYLSSGYEYPERYSRWDVASIAPPVEIVAAGREIDFRPLNQRGEVLNQILYPLFEHHPHWDEFAFKGSSLHGRLKPLPKLFPEEERSKQPSAFSILRALIEEFRSQEDSRLALVGAFGYDLLFQFDPIELKLPRDGHKDLHLFLCDDIYYMDRKKERIERFRYDFALGGLSTAGLERTGHPIRRPPKRETGEITSDHQPE
jgi:anthranilate synthase